MIFSNFHLVFTNKQIVFVVVSFFLFFNLNLHLGSYEYKKKFENIQIDESKFCENPLNENSRTGLTSQLPPEEALYATSCGTNFKKAILHNRYISDDKGILDNIRKPHSKIFAEMNDTLMEILKDLAIVISFEDHHGFNDNNNKINDKNDFNDMKNVWEEFLKENAITKYKFSHSKSNFISTIKDEIFQDSKYFIITHYSTLLFIPNILRSIYETKTNSHSSNLYMGFPTLMSASNIEIKAYKNIHISDQSNSMLYGSILGGIIMNKNAKDALLLSEDVYNEILEKKGDQFNVDEIIGRCLILKEIFLTYKHVRENIQKNPAVKMKREVPYGFYPVSPNDVIDWLDDSENIPEDYFRDREDPFWAYEPPLSFGGIFAIEEDRNRFVKISKIPKIMHQIWVGPASIPREMLDCQKKYEECGWEVKIWDDVAVEKLIRNKGIYKRLENAPKYKKADIIRLEILYEYGGFVVDGDSVCLRSMDVLIEDTYNIERNMLASCENERIRPGLIATGIVGATPKSFSMYLVLRSLYLTNIEGVAWVSVGPYFLTRVIRSFDIDINVLSSKLFFPLHHVEVKRTVKKYVKKRMFNLSEKYNSFTLQLWGSTFYFDEVLIKTPKRNQADKYLWHVDNKQRSDDNEVKEIVQDSNGGEVGNLVEGNENDNKIITNS